MALNLSRWWKYAQAKANRAVSDAERELDELEAERAEQVADRPWLADDAEAPSFDTARARIEWEAARNAEGPTAADSQDGTHSPVGPAAMPSTGASEPEVEAARLELDRREREAKARLEAMRDELGIDPPS